MNRSEILEGFVYHLQTDSLLGGDRLKGVRPFENGREMAEAVGELLLSTHPVPQDFAVRLRRVLATLVEAEAGPPEDRARDGYQMRRLLREEKP